MADKGKKDKGGRETKKKPKLTIKEKRKQKKEKKQNQGYQALWFLIRCHSELRRDEASRSSQTGFNSSED